MDFMIGNLQQDLKKQLISASILLDSLTVISDSSRLSNEYLDASYYPFYYYLGKYIEPKSFLEIGFNLGFASACFFKSCKSVTSFLAFQQKKDNYYSSKIAQNNIKKYYKNSFLFVTSETELFLSNLNEKIDLCIINDVWSYDKARLYFDFVYNNLTEKSLLVVDHLSDKNMTDAFRDFCKIHQMEVEYFDTRYKVGVAIKNGL